MADRPPVRTSVRTGFGLPRPIVGAPLLLVRTAWVLIPVGIIAIAVQLASVYFTRNVPTIWEPGRLDRVIEYLRIQQPGAAIHVISPNINAWMVRVGMDELVELVGASLVVVAGTYWIVGRDSNLSAVLSLLVRKARKLVVIWFISRGLVACVIVTGLLLILGSARVNAFLMPGLVLVLVGGICGTISALLLFAALPIVVVERTGTFRALGRSAVLAMRRLLPVVGTIALAKLAAWVLGLIIGGGAHLVATGLETSWPVVGVQQGIVAALAVAIDGVLYLLRYLDTRARKEGYNRAALVAELDAAAATRP